MLTASDLLTYLLRRGLVVPETVVDGDLLIVDGSRRHRNFRVVSSGGCSYFVKQDADADGVGTVGYEAAVYRLLEAKAPGGETDLLLPRFSAYDPEQGILLLDLVPDAENLREHQVRRKCFPPALAALAGRSTAALHRSFRREALERPDFLALSRQPPAILSMHRPPLHLLQSVSAANVALVRQIQQFPQFCALLEETARGWSADAVVHGDLRWDNCLILRASRGKSQEKSERTRKVAIRLIDWEYAAIGDPAWDVGAFLSQYLSFWILSIPATAEGSPADLARRATSPIERMRPAMRAFWSTYVRTAGLDDAAAEERLLRAARYVGVRLLEAAFEGLHKASQLSRTAAHLVQLSMNVLERPRDAVSQLLGITLPESSTA